VRFLGPGTRDDVVALFRAVDVGLLTSAWENLPHTLLEALAVGTPVIATAVGGIPEVVVDGKNGVLVPAGDVAAIAAAIDRLRTDDELRRALARAAAASVADLSEPRILQRIVQSIVGEDDR
jgi:2-deoxystreptamine N-acetyl-D-glucosaminyltransferase/2-deoxystreptamine glucosyltransferase